MRSIENSKGIAQVSQECWNYKDEIKKPEAKRLNTQNIANKIMSDVEACNQTTRSDKMSPNYNWDVQVDEQLLYIYADIYLATKRVKISYNFFYKFVSKLGMDFSTNLQFNYNFTSEHCPHLWTLDKLQNTATVYIIEKTIKHFNNHKHYLISADRIWDKTDHFLSCPRTRYYWTQINWLFRCDVISSGFDSILLNQNGVRIDPFL